MKNRRMIPRDEVLRVARESCDWNGQTCEMNDVGLTTLYRAAYIAGLEAAKMECVFESEACYPTDPDYCADAIQQLIDNCNTLKP